MKKKKTFPVIIGGPGRSGKTYLLKNINDDEDSNYAVLLEDAIIDKNITLNSLKNFQDEELFLKSYLQKNRFIDPSRRKVSSLINNFNISLNQLMERITQKKYPKSVLKSIFDCFHVLAETKDKDSWVALDIHSEFYFQKYKTICKDLKLIVLLRSPIEVVCAHLFWKKNNYEGFNHKRMFFYSLFFWLLSQRTAYRLKSKFPDDVYIINNKIALNNNLNLSKIFHFKKSINLKPLYFDYDKKTKLFYYYNNKWKKLLTDKEIKFFNEFEYLISKTSKDKLKIDFKTRLIFLILNLIVMIGTLNPHLTRYIATYFFFPSRFISYIKEIIKKKC